MVEKLAFNSLVTALVDIPAVSMPTAHFPSKLEISVALSYVTKSHILEWPFIVPQHKVHLCNDQEI
jgi:hypothetical protein